jgi:signal transduction histidine kinase
LPAVPTRVALLLQAFVAEEAGSFLRHGLRNKLAAIRNAAFYLRKKVESADPRVGQMLGLIETELASTEELLQSRLPPADPLAHCDVGTVASALCSELQLPMDIVPATVRGNAGELELALWCLLENAFATGASSVKVTCQRHPAGGVVIEVTDDAGDRSAMGPGPAFDLPIARRIASRCGAMLKLEPGHATLLLAEAGGG